MSWSGNITRYVRGTRALIVLGLVVIYAGAAGYYLMSDMSVRGLTVQIHYVYRFCDIDPDSSAEVVTYAVTASVWSTTSIQTSLENVQFAMWVDGVDLGLVDERSASFGPGEGAPYSLMFQDPTLSPLLLPQSSELLVTITAEVQAGIAGASLTRSDMVSEDFGSTSC